MCSIAISAQVMGYQLGLESGVWGRDYGLLHAGAREILPSGGGGGLQNMMGGAKMP